MCAYFTFPLCVSVICHSWFTLNSCSLGNHWSRIQSHLLISATIFVVFLHLFYFLKHTYEWEKSWCIMSPYFASLIFQILFMAFHTLLFFFIVPTCTYICNSLTTPLCLHMQFIFPFMCVHASVIHLFLI